MNDKDIRAMDLKCQELENRLAGIDSASLTRDEYLEVIDCWLWKHLPTDKARDETKRKAIQQYLVARSQYAQVPIDPRETKRMPEPLQPQAKMADPHVAIATGITDITEEQRAQIKALVVNDHSSDYQTLEQRLRDEFWELNWDWRRIACTENAIKANDKYLSRLKPGEQVMWLPFPGSCKYCQALAGRVFRVVAASQKEKNPEEEVWVGKTMENHGKRLNPLIRLPSGRLRKRQSGERKSPAAPLHEHCRCTWIALPTPIGGLVVTKSKESAVGQRLDPVDAQGRISPDVGISPASLEPGKTKKGSPLPRRPYTPLYVDRRRKG
jgi:hypothetical protein